MHIIQSYTNLLTAIRDREKTPSIKQQDFDDAQRSLTAFTNFYADCIQDGIKMEREERTGKRDNQPYLADVQTIINGARTLNRLCKKYGLPYMCPNPNDVHRIVDFAQKVAIDIIKAAINEEKKKQIENKEDAAASSSKKPAQSGSKPLLSGARPTGTSRPKKTLSGG